MEKFLLLIGLITIAVAVLLHDRYQLHIKDETIYRIDKVSGRVEIKIGNNWGTLN
jgi:hypothetical protein